MKRVYMKLFITALAMLVSVLMVLSVTYAWMVFSQSPAVNGISVMIGGGKTILLAPDLTTTVVDNATEETITVHYPGTFSDTLDLSSCSTYPELSCIKGLTPISTADGRYWMLPKYDDNGALMPLESFTVDDSLEYANLSDDGCYAYLDFWIVSPGADYNVRVSTDSRTFEGSYLVELPGVTTDAEGNLTLSKTQDIVSTSARVGFLVNTDTAQNQDMVAYASSAGFDTRYSSLRGVYQDKGETVDPNQITSFLIYEPNGTQRPSDNQADGSYLKTYPLGYDPVRQQIAQQDVSDHLTVQEQTIWKSIENGASLEQQFQTAMAGQADLSPTSAADYFYGTFLQGQLKHYLATGLFLNNTPYLYGTASEDTVSAEAVSALESQGATDTAVITKLERNVPQRIRMFIWLEGQDPDCVNAGKVSASQISLRLELAGSER